jgi:hypothetical protein
LKHQDIKIWPEPSPGETARLWSKDGKRLHDVPRVGAFEYVAFSTSPAVGFGAPVPTYRAFPVSAAAS